MVPNDKVGNAQFPGSTSTLQWNLLDALKTSFHGAGHPRAGPRVRPPSFEDLFRFTEALNTAANLEQAPPRRKPEADFKELVLWNRNPFEKSVAIPNTVEILLRISDPVTEDRFEVALPTALMAQTLRHIELVKSTLRQLFPSLPLESCFELGVGYDCISGETEDDNLNFIPGTRESQIRFSYSWLKYQEILKLYG